MRIALVGPGWFAKEAHGPALARYAEEHPGEIELAAVCSRSVERARAFADTFGFSNAYGNFEEMLDSETLDACWVVTAAVATRDVAGQLMERRIPILLEKPPGANLVEARELAEISRQTGTPNMVAFNRRWAPATRGAIEWIADMKKVEYVYARMLRSNRMDEHFAFETGIHLLDCVRFFADTVCGGIVSARTQRRQTAAGAMNFHVDCEFSSGARGRCDIIPTAGVLEESYALFGANSGTIVNLPYGAESGDVPGRTELWVDGERARSKQWPAAPHYLAWGIYNEDVEFISALKEGRKPSPSVEESVDSVALAEAVQDGRDVEF